MSRVQFSLTGLILAVCVLAIACAAITSELAFVASAVLTVKWFLLALGVVGVVARRGADRTFWVGFVVFGYVYSTAADQTVGQEWAWIRRNGTWPNEDTIITDQLLQLAFSQRRYAPKVGTIVEGEWSPGGFYQARVTQVAPDGSALLQWLDGSAPKWVPTTGVRESWRSFRSTGHSVFSILASLLGGYIAIMIFARDSERRSSGNQQEATGDRVDERFQASK